MSTTTATAACPHPIRSYLQQQLQQVLQISASSEAPAIVVHDDLEMKVEAAVSTQQLVLIITLPETTAAAMSREEAIESQQNLRDYNQHDDDPQSTSSITNCASIGSSFESWNRALQDGRHRLAIRIWKGASRWWNLNYPQYFYDGGGSTADSTVRQAKIEAARFTTESLLEQQLRHRLLLREAAQCEIRGYQIAREVLQQQRSKSDTIVRIPDVLYCSWWFESDSHSGCMGNDTLSNEQEQFVYPWAVLEYVGIHSTLFHPVQHPMDKTWMDSMIVMREEFGFMEPHPRWGRVPVDKAWSYAQSVLDSITLPMHRYFQQQQQWQQLQIPRNDEDEKSPNGQRTQHAYSYMDMVQLYAYRYPIIQQIAAVDKETDMTSREKLAVVVTALGQAIQTLHSEAIEAGLNLPSSTLPPTLCHMDCQPQNIMFAHDHDSPLPIIVSVLDWEESAMADPRFELLLIARKVLANREQANQLWMYYEDHMSPPNDQLGPIEPWLKLETVHSLMTLMLQACAGGGRHPWESKPDLWGKIEREFQRLRNFGWDFIPDL